VQGDPGLVFRVRLVSSTYNLFHQSNPLKHTHIYTAWLPDLLFQSTLIFSFSPTVKNVCLYFMTRVNEGKRPV